MLYSTNATATHGSGMLVPIIVPCADSMAGIGTIAWTVTVNCLGLQLLGPSVVETTTLLLAGWRRLQWVGSLEAALSCTLQGLVATTACLLLGCWRLLKCAQL